MLRSIVAVTLAVCLMAGAGVAGEKPWFDMSCAMCSNMVKHDGLMENVNWEQVNINEGVAALCTVNEKYIDAYRTAHADMEKTGDTLVDADLRTLPMQTKRAAVLIYRLASEWNSR